MTDELHDLLHAAVPDPPAAPDRAALARDRARRTRRRTAAVLGLAAAVLVGATATVPTLVDDRLDPAGPRPIRAPIPTPAAVHIACPAPDEPTHGPGTVLPGAVAIRLCPGPGISFDAPADVLVSDVDRVAETINRQATGPFPSLPCQMDLGRGYQLVFGYPDGHTQNVAGELYGCHTLTVGGVVRSNPEKPFATFIRLLRSQRAHEQPPSNPTSGPPCPQGGLATLSPVGRAREMVAATLCVRWPTETEHAPVAVAVPDADLATLLADRVRRPDPSLHDPTYDPQAPELRLVGETAWGDTVAVWIADDWWPGPRARATLDRLVARAARPHP